MDNRKKLPTLAKKVVTAWMVVLVLVNLIIAGFSYVLYRNELFESRAHEAENVATAMAVRIDGDKFADIMGTLEKNDYWHEVKDYADTIAVVFNTAFIYILDAKYTDEVTYFAEGAPGDAPFDLGDTEIIEDVYADEMFDTIKSGESSFTEPYPSGDYGDMVSGFAAIKDSSGKVVGVVGVDFYYSGVMETLTYFTAVIIIILVIANTLCYFLMSYLGHTLAGRPLTDLDMAARRFAVGDMDISFNIHSTTEIGRLAASFTRMIDGMKEQVAALETLSNGDLTSDVQPRGERDTMGIAITQILENLNDMLKEIQQSAANVSSGSKQLSDNAQSLAHGASEQAGAIERLSASLTDVTAKANENREIASKTNKLTDAIKSNAQVGSQHMDRMLLAVKEITDASAAIGKVIKAIDDIAFQTNILALNAAVEAARAGQHGKGFAVVAEEVRNLASKSAEAAKDSERLILNSMEKAQLGVTIADETVANLNKIIEGVNECAASVSVIAGSFDEQLSSMAEINKEIENVSRIVHENTSSAEESAAASEEMSGQSEMLQNLVAQFKIKGGSDALMSSSHAPSSQTKRLTMPEKSAYGPTGQSTDFGKY